MLSVWLRALVGAVIGIVLTGTQSYWASRIHQSAIRLQGTRGEQQMGLRLTMYPFSMERPSTFFTAIEHAKVWNDHAGLRRFNPISDPWELHVCLQGMTEPTLVLPLVKTALIEGQYFDESVFMRDEFLSYRSASDSTKFTKQLTEYQK